ncbi:hypothetical protein G5Y40_001581 [Escherichia coli]|nr:hypothetical protein [Escherichia coli]EFJ3495118.1 hypothetical protein [Escherichia coli]
MGSPHNTVFPAPAGINLLPLYRYVLTAGVPRASGDKPFAWAGSPKTARVFPAPAGINRLFT